MLNEQILEALDDEIARLSQVRAILSSSKMSGKANAVAPAEAGEKPRRTLSPKARRAIAEAQHRRWERVHSLKRDAASATAAPRKDSAAG